MKRIEFNRVTILLGLGAIVSFTLGCVDPAANTARITAECPALKVGAGVVGMAVPAAGLPLGLATGLACAAPAVVGGWEAWAAQGLGG